MVLYVGLERASASHGITNLSSVNTFISVKIFMKTNGINLLFVNVGGSHSQWLKWSKSSYSFLALSDMFWPNATELPKNRPNNQIVTYLKQSSITVLFTNIAFIRFLNKTDHFEEKVKHIGINNCFLSFNKNTNLQTHIQEFILNIIRYFNSHVTKKGLDFWIPHLKFEFS